MQPVRNHELTLSIIGVLAVLSITACGGDDQGSTSTTTTVAAAGGAPSAGASSSTTSTSSTTTEPGGPDGGGCPQGTYVLQDPGSGLPFQISSGGTGTVLRIDADDRVELSFDDYVTATGTASGGTFSIEASGTITATLVEGADGTFTLSDVDASGITGQQTVALEGGDPITISGPEFTQLAQGLAPYGPGATLECSPSGDLLASAGPITQTYVRS